MTGSIFPSYRGMVGILKFVGGMVVEMLTGNGDFVSIGLPGQDRECSAGPITDQSALRFASSAHP